MLGLSRRRIVGARLPDLIITAESGKSRGRRATITTNAARGSFEVELTDVVCKGHPPLRAAFLRELAVPAAAADPEHGELGPRRALARRDVLGRVLSGAQRGQRGWPVRLGRHPRPHPPCRGSGRARPADRAQAPARRQRAGRHRDRDEAAAPRRHDARDPAARAGRAGRLRRAGVRRRRGPGPDRAAQPRAPARGPLRRDAGASRLGDVRGGRGRSAPPFRPRTRARGRFALELVGGVGAARLRRRVERPAASTPPASTPSRARSPTRRTRARSALRGSRGGR